jgi:quercetin dioxygenase-like cupin family protein
MSSHPTWYFRAGEKGLQRVLGPGVIMRVFVGRQIMLSFVEVSAETTTAIHSHPEEQWGYLLTGKCIRIQNGEEIEMEAGDFWLTPADVTHGIRTGAVPVQILDIFSPPRQLHAEPQP